MDLLNLHSADEAYAEVKKLASALTEEQHHIRSCIFDLHAAVEAELRRIFYHTFKAQLFLTHDEKQNDDTLKKFDKTVARLGFMDMYRVLRPVLDSWPSDDLRSIQAINETRNMAAHGDNTDKVLYKERNPFLDADCFAQLYFDVWAIKQSMSRFFDMVIEKPKAQLRRYVEKYGSGLL